MGCHTWFYTNSHRTFKEAIRKALIEVRKASIEVQNVVVDSELEESSDTAIAIKYFELLEKLLVLDGGSLYGTMLWSLQPEDGIYIHTRFGGNTHDSSEEALGHNGIYYIPVQEYHDAFRVNHYPAKRLFSFRDLVIWLCSPLTWWKYRPRITYTSVKKVHAFFKKYKEGIIEFG